MEGEEKQFNNDESHLKISPEMLCDFDALADAIFKTFAKELNMILPCISMYHQRTNDLRFVYESTDRRVVETLKKYYNKSISDFVFPVTETKNALVESFTTGQIVIEESVERLAHPYITNKFVISAIDKIIRLKMIVITPIIVDGTTIGVFAFGSRKKQKLSDSDTKFLQSFSSSVGGYLRNCWLLSRSLMENGLLMQENTKLKQYIKINQDFLMHLSSILEEMLKEPASMITPKILEENISYLKSLVLMSDSLKVKIQNPSL